MPQTKPKFAKNSAEIEASNGDIAFIAARSVKNLNGYTYDIKSLQAQNVDGDYQTLKSDATSVSIPLMSDHSSSIKDKIGTIDEAHIESIAGVDQIVMHANFFDTDEAQEVRQRILNGQLTDVSITTDWGDFAETEDELILSNSHIIEVSVVYAGAEPKAKIFAKNAVDTEENTDLSDEQLDTLAEKVAEKLKNQTEDSEEAPDPVEEETNNSDEESEGEEEVPTQPTNTTDNVADKGMVLNALAKLAESGAIRGMNRSQVITAVKNEVEITDGDGGTYVVPDAVFTEILAVERPTDILDTFTTVPVKRITIMSEARSEADLARAGRWSKGELKQIQELQLVPQKFATQFLYKLQELSYEDLQEDFGDLLLAFIRNELPQKVTEEEERDFIVGDGRAANAPRKITSIVSLDAAAEDTENIHVAKYDGSGDASPIAAVLKGVGQIAEEGELYAVMSKTTLGEFRAAGLSTAAGLPFSEDTIAGALGVSKIFTRDYVPADVVYVWTRGGVKRLTGGRSGETIEQYDIDYNNRKIEFIRPVGGGATGLQSAVKVVLPESISA